MWKTWLFFIYTAILSAAFIPYAHADMGAITYDTQFVSKFGSTGTGNGQFNTAESIVRGPDDRLYVADRFNHRIQVFDLQGNYISEFGGLGAGFGQLVEPTYVTFDANGTIAVSSMQTDKIVFYDPNTYTTVSEINGIDGPHGMINVGNNLYAVSLYNQRVKVYDASGNFVTDLGVGTLSFPHFITQTSDGKFYVTEYLAGHVKVFDSNFNHIGAIGVGDLDRPVGIYKDGYDNIFVVDSEHDRVVVFDKNGNILTTYGTRGSGDGQFYGARGIFVADDGTFYTTEGYSFVDNQALNNRVQEFLFSSTETFSASPGTGDQNATTDYAILKLENNGTFNDDFIGYDDLILDGEWSLSGTNSFDKDIVLQQNSHLTIDASGNASADDIILSNDTHLTINGSLTSNNDLVITNGSLLNGSGSINADTVIANGATIAPGNSIGTLTINGDYTHNANGTYQVEVNDAGQSDRIVVNGNVTLNGGLVDVQAAGGTYGTLNTYTILTSTGTITGTFSNVTSNLAFLTPSLVYNPSSVQLRLTQNGNSFEDVAATPNQTSTSKALDTFLASGNADSAALETAFSNLTVEEVHKLLDQIAPDEIASLRQTQRQLTLGLNTLMIGRFDALTARELSVDRGTSVDFNALASAAGGNTPMHSRNFWFQGTANKNFKDDDGNAAGYISSVTSMRGGIDKEINPSFILGFSPAYARAVIDYKGEADKASIEYYRGDVYGLYHRGPWNVSVTFGAGVGRQEASRIIDTGIPTRTAISDNLYKDISLSAGVEYHMPLLDDFYMKPGMGFAAGWSHQNSFTETGADSLNLHYESVDDAFVQFSPKITLGKIIPVKESGMIFNPYIGTGVIIRPDTIKDTQRASFATTPDTDFSVSAPRNQPFSFEVGTGFILDSIDQRDTPSVQVNYNGVFNQTEQNHAVTARLTWPF